MPAERFRVRICERGVNECAGLAGLSVCVILLLADEKWAAAHGAIAQSRSQELGLAQQQRTGRVARQLGSGLCSQL